MIKINHTSYDMFGTEARSPSLFRKGFQPEQVGSAVLPEVLQADPAVLPCQADENAGFEVDAEDHLVRFAHRSVAVDRIVGAEAERITS